MKKNLFPLVSIIIFILTISIFGSIICRQNRQLLAITHTLNRITAENARNGSTLTTNKKIEGESSKLEKDISTLENSLRNSNEDEETIKRVLNELAKKNGLKTTQHFILGQFNTDTSLVFPEPAYVEHEIGNSTNPFNGYIVHLSEYPNLRFSITDTPTTGSSSFAKECTAPNSRKISIAGIEFCEVTNDDVAMGKYQLITTYSTTYKDTPILIEFNSEYSGNVPPDMVASDKIQQKNIEKLIPEIMKTIKIKPFEQVE